MAESSLSIGVSELRAEVGWMLNYGRTSGNWSAAQLSQINNLVTSGVRRVYYPPAIDESVLAYEWSWLRPTTTLSVVSGTSDYDLSDDFGSFVGSLHFPTAEYRESARRVSVAKVLAMRAYDSLTGPPRYFATRFKDSDGSAGQRQEILLYPEPDTDWEMVYEYEAFSGELTDSYPYPLGGMKLAELYIESCLAVAESRVRDELGIHTQTYQALLVDAVARDRKNSAVYYGRMGQQDPEVEQFRRGHTGGTYPISYHGTDL